MYRIVPFRPWDSCGGSRRDPHVWGFCGAARAPTADLAQPVGASLATQQAPLTGGASLPGIVAMGPRSLWVMSRSDRLSYGCGRERDRARPCSMSYAEPCSSGAVANRPGTSTPVPAVPGDMRVRRQHERRRQRSSRGRREAGAYADHLRTCLEARIDGTPIPAAPTPMITAQAAERQAVIASVTKPGHVGRS